MNVHLFNFSHDLALAKNIANYTPPRNVQIMERDLASLVGLLPEAEVAYTEHAPVWGWDLSLVCKLRRGGCKGLPTEEQLADIRRLSSRFTAVEMLPAIRQQLPRGTTLGESLMLGRKEAGVWSQELMFNAQSSMSNGQWSILKAPYSGSGRGLKVVETKNVVAEISRLQSQFATQGGIVAEPYYDKVADFALEYLATPDEVQFLGVSVFETNANNAYCGNYVAPQSILWQKISQLMPHLDFERLIEVVSAELKGRFVGRYLGPLGVDMMVVKEGEELFVHPCVEVNVRRTMGELSLHMLPLLAEGVEGFFSIIYERDSASLHHSVSAMLPAVYDDKGHLVSGTSLLTPLAADTHYAAVIEVHSPCRND